MFDSHYHRAGYPAFSSSPAGEFRFLGIHPWQTGDEGFDLGREAADLGAALAGDPHAGVGETGLDRLRSRTVGPVQRAAFAAQLEMAARLRRPVVLHGAKCWGEVVKACLPYRGRIPAFLFHGFSRSGGLLPDIVALNGFVSVGPAVCNDHAVNYRRLVGDIPSDRLLIETDSDLDGMADGAPGIDAVFAATLAVRGGDAEALRSVLAANAARFTETLA